MILSNINIVYYNNDILALELIDIRSFLGKKKYIYKDVFNLDSDIAYVSKEPVKKLHLISFYMTEEECRKYFSNTLSDNEIKSVIFKAIKYEQEKLFPKDEQVKKTLKP